MPVVAVWLLSVFHGSPWGVVGVCMVLNLISLAMILIGPETRGIDMNRIDPPAQPGGSPAYAALSGETRRNNAI